MQWRFASPLLVGSFLLSIGCGGSTRTTASDGGGGSGGGTGGMTTSATGGATAASGGHTAMSTGGSGGRNTGGAGAMSSGGKGGNGGKGGASGGAGGRPSTGGIPNDAGGPDGSSSPFDGGCADYSTLYALSWGYNGGLVASVDTSRIDTPQMYTHSREQVRNGMGSIMCQTQVAGCPSSLLAEINAAVKSIIVMNALRAHTVYGVDSRPVDGTVFRVMVGNDYVDVGDPCAAGSSGCTAIPPVVQELVNALKAVDAQEMAKKACVDVFGAPATP